MQTDIEQNSDRNDTQTKGDTWAKRGFVERRRPGRLAYVSPELLPLLRGQDVDSTLAGREETTVEQNQCADRRDQEMHENELSAVQGVSVAMVLATLFWLAVMVVAVNSI